MVKKAFINKKSAKHFSLVHRSQHDPLVADGEASKYVLLPTLASGNRKGRSKAKVNDAEKEIEEDKLDELVQNDNEDNRNKAVQFGIFFEDDYDYTQHLKPMGESGDGVFISNPKAEKEKKKTVSFQLPEEALPSKFKTEVGIMNQPAFPDDLHYGMDPDVLDALDALEDDAYVETGLGDAFFDQLDESGEEDYQEEEEEEDLDENAGWEEHFKRFQKHQKNSDSEEDSQEGFGGHKSVDRRTTASKYSMTSSAMFRNEKLTLLDDQFDRIEEEYMEEDTDDDEAPELVALRSDFDKIMDDFLDNFEVVGKKMVPRMEGETGADKFTHMRESLIKPTYISDDEVDPDVQIEKQFNVDVDEKIINNWDAQSILSTYSNIYNRPAMIVEPTGNKARIKLNSRGFPSVRFEPVQQPDDDEDEEEEEDEEKIRLDNSRTKEETAEEKKARKNLVKQLKKDRRVQKKETKLQFQKDYQQARKTQTGAKVREISLE